MKKNILIFTMILLTACTPSEPCSTNEGEDIYGIVINYSYHSILRVSDRALFSSCGEINMDVYENLMAILNNESLNPMLRPEAAVEWGAYFAVTAADFSDFVVPYPQNMSQSGAIIIKLFETIPNRYGPENGFLTEFTRQWWQLVYRSTDGERDVLTLWMMQPYRLTTFNGNGFDLSERGDFRFINRRGDTVWTPITPGANTILSDYEIVNNLAPSPDYFFEGNYSAGILRANLLRDTSFLLDWFNIEEFLVAPKYIPGQWQSSWNQTGTNTNHVYYATGQFYIYRQDFPGSTHPLGGLGAAGLIWGRHFHFSLLNGKDGLSIGPFYNHWPHTRVMPTYNDLIWLPSDFETRSMGHSRDPALFQTFITDPWDYTSPLRTNVDNDTRPDHTGGRSGLWQLNGFDRSFDAAAFAQTLGRNVNYTTQSPEDWEVKLVWLRSADVLGIGNANTIFHTGNRYGYGVNQNAGLRPALHLNIGN